MSKTRSAQRILSLVTLLSIAITLAAFSLDAGSAFDDLARSARVQAFETTAFVGTLSLYLAIAAALANIGLAFYSRHQRGIAALALTASLATFPLMIYLTIALGMK